MTMPKERRQCWFCKHFVVDADYPACSTVTPGGDLELYCTKDWWDSEDWTSAVKFGEDMASAKTCEDFELNDWVAEEIEKGES